MSARQARQAEDSYINCDLAAASNEAVGVKVLLFEIDTPFLAGLFLDFPSFARVISQDEA